MAVSGITNYRDVLYQWQGQQLKNTGSGKSGSSSSNMLSSLFGGTTSMVSQISSMIELTKYAMDAMGVSSDSRVTFSQITKYREKLQNEFNQSVKNGLADSGISDISALTFSLDKDGALSVAGANASDRKTAQAWLDANPSFGKDLRAALEKEGLETEESVTFRLSASGKMTLVDSEAESMQASLDKEPDLTKNLRQALEKIGVSLDYGLEFAFDENGNLAVAGDNARAEEINAWLAENRELADAVKKQLEKKDIDPSQAGLRLGGEGNVQIHVDSAANRDIQAALDKSLDLGQKIAAGLDGLGIDPDINFSIQVNEDGTVNISSDHPDRDKVQRFFDENPDVVKLYRQIETLAGIDDARAAMQISKSAMRKRIQIESMAAWWAGSNSASSYFGAYQNGSMSLLSGLNLNI